MVGLEVTRLASIDLLEVFAYYGAKDMRRCRIAADLTPLRVAHKMAARRVFGAVEMAGWNARERQARLAVPWRFRPR